MMKRRQFLCCLGAAGAGLFTGLAEARPIPEIAQALVHEALQGLDARQLWDAHCHLLGNGDSGSGCELHPSLDQWWRPVEFARKRFILAAAGVQGAGVDAGFVSALHRLGEDFPEGSRWLLFAFERAYTAQGAMDAEHTTFHVPNAYAAAVAQAHPGRFGWVASVHPYREDAVPALAHCLQQGAVAVKWLPSSMAIDPLNARCRPFYELLAARRVPLIVHCGDEHAVPGAEQQAFSNPLRVRAALECGVRVVVAHCASLGEGEDLDARSRRKQPNFALFVRLMQEWPQLMGDVSAITQRNRNPEVLRTLLRRGDWHGRLLHGSDHPLPGLSLLTSYAGLARMGLLAKEDIEPLAQLRRANPLLADLVLKRRLREGESRFDAAVFATARHFSGAA
ncbi:MAG: amidohydrolase family protein [Burkholderiales bacterium]|uniref:amidohydrolase family protein n=1 Tax=Inhella sp. TaxID=1921806 RepID=UPI001AC2AC3D|nr:amidohydrolase family protein [Burkholderiales bacterium]